MNDEYFKFTNHIEIAIDIIEESNETMRNYREFVSMFPL